jgi:hypothetical protein
MVVRYKASLILSSRRQARDAQIVAMFRVVVVT